MEGRRRMPFEGEGGRRMPGRKDDNLRGGRRRPQEKEEDTLSGRRRMPLRGGWNMTKVEELGECLKKSRFS